MMNIYHLNMMLLHVKLHLKMKLLLELQILLEIYKLYLNKFQGGIILWFKGLYYLKESYFFLLQYQNFFRLEETDFF